MPKKLSQIYYNIISYKKLETIHILKYHAHKVDYQFVKNFTSIILNKVIITLNKVMIL